MTNELGMRAAKLFTPKPWKHYFVACRCIKCDMTSTDWYSGEKLEDCTWVRPIDINWDNAMRLFREVSKDEAIEAFVKIVRNRTGMYHTYFDCTYYATPADYILAACIAKENEIEAM